MSENPELWLITAYILGSISSFFLFSKLYTNFITGQLISVLEKDGLIRVERNDEGELDVKPAGMDYDDFLERLMDDLEEERESRNNVVPFETKDEDKL